MELDHRKAKKRMNFAWQAIKVLFLADLRPKDFAVLILVVFAVTVGSGANGLK